VREVVAIAHKREVRVNERIRVPQVRVIGADGTQVGVMSARDALALAREQSLDIVEVSPDASPPVCRIMDFGKFKYEQSKRARKAKKKQHVMHVKEVKLRLKIEDHDYQFKANNARKFLDGRDKVKFTVILRGRELDRVSSGIELLHRVAKDLEDIGQVETPPRKEGRTIVMILVPKPIRKGGRPQDAKDGAGQEDAEAKNE
jgi:translation initiation factor IF-3